MLTPSGCRVRQQRLRQALADQGIDAAVINDPHEIYYFSGLLLPDTPFAPPALLWIDARSTWLVAASGMEAEAVDEVLNYEGSQGSTVNPDQMRLMNALATTRLSGLSAQRIGWQADALPRLLGVTIDSTVHPDEWVAIDDLVNMMERRKDADEIALIRRAVAVDLAAYRAAQAAIQPGVNELDVLAAGKRGALHEAGEVVWHGGDYQSGKIGGWARDRKVEAGELYIIDAQTRYQGYWSDLSRAYIVGDTITEMQQSIFDHLKGIHDRIPAMLKPGVDGSVIWQVVDGMVREHPALAETGLIHHAGHNIGLRAHEMPDLNPNRGGMLEVGNVVTVEPGAYLDAVRGGVRLENMYLITENGAENLSVYPMSLR